MVEQADQKGATSGAAPATAADFASLQRRIEQLGAAVSQATNGLKLYRSEEDIIERIRKRFIYALGIVAVLSFFGIQGIAYVIIDQQWGKELKDRVDDATKAVTRAQMSTEQAIKASTEASNAATEASNAATEANQVRIKLKDLLEDTKAEIKALRQGPRTDAKTQGELNLTSMQAEIEKLSAEIKLVSSNVESAHGKKVVRSDVSDDAKRVTVEGPPKSDGPIKLSPCNPDKLTEPQIGLISIEQRVEETNTFSSNDNRYYRNIFSVAIRRVDGTSVPKAVGKCILDAIDRVDYLLSEYWFKPPRRRGSNRDANFRYSIRVWGVTPVIAEVYLKGDQPTLKKRGWFSVSDGEVTHFESENGGAIIPQ